MSDPYDLQRFLEAQEDVYPQALAELRAGRKESHWMWFVLPQPRGLGSSAMSEYFGLTSLEEARAYAAHPELGARLREATEALLAAPSHLSAQDILGTPDDLKLRSCLTAFLRACPEEERFARALERFFEGVPDKRSLELLEGR